MSFSSDHLEELAAAAIDAATQAGSIIAERTGGDLKVALKSDREDRAAQVLTEVDGLSQTCILEVLEPTTARFDLGLLAEESSDDHSRFEKEAFWCIDPLDGTLPFIEGDPGYAVSIALVGKDGTPLIGVIYDPRSATLYHAIHDTGAFRNNAQWNPLGASTKGDSLRFLNDRSFANHALYRNTLEAFEAFAHERGYAKVETQLQGGAAMNAIWALENASACYLKFPNADGGGSLWDYAATACIYREAGAIAEDFFGKPFELNRSKSTFMNHRGVIFATDRDIAALAKTLDPQ